MDYAEMTIAPLDLGPVPSVGFTADDTLPMEFDVSPLASAAAARAEESTVAAHFLFGDSLILDQPIANDNYAQIDYTASHKLNPYIIRNELKCEDCGRSGAWAANHACDEIGTRRFAAQMESTVIHVEQE